jgi:hypothetical protein
VTAAPEGLAEVEASVLGAMLLAPEAIDRVGKCGLGACDAISAFFRGSRLSWLRRRSGSLCSSYCKSSFARSRNHTFSSRTLIGPWLVVVSPF